MHKMKRKKLNKNNPAAAMIKNSQKFSNKSMVAQASHDMVAALSTLISMLSEKMKSGASRKR